MSNANKIIVGVAGIVIAFIVGLSFGKPSVGGRYNVTESSFIGGLKAGLTDQLSISSAGVLTTSGAITTTGNITGATETLSGILTLNKAVGCVELYATSTATRIHLYASSTATIEGVDGVLMFTYGGC